MMQQLVCLPVIYANLFIYIFLLVCGHIKDTVLPSNSKNITCYVATTYVTVAMGCITKYNYCLVILVIRLLANTEVFVPSHIL